MNTEPAADPEALTRGDVDHPARHHVPFQRKPEPELLVEDTPGRRGGGIEEEHRLRKAVGGGTLDPSEEHRRLAEVEQALDQCWDLLRQRRALREAGRDPGAARVRDPDVVEGYQQ